MFPLKQWVYGPEPHSPRAHPEARAQAHPRGRGLGSPPTPRPRPHPGRRRPRRAPLRCGPPASPRPPAGPASPAARRPHRSKAIFSGPGGLRALGLRARCLGWTPGPARMPGRPQGWGSLRPTGSTGRAARARKPEPARWEGRPASSPQGGGGAPGHPDPASLGRHCPCTCRLGRAWTLLSSRRHRERRRGSCRS